VLVFKKTDYRKILRLNSCQLIENFDNTIDIINKSLLSITDLKSEYIITEIYNNKSENRICFDISN